MEISIPELIVFIIEMRPWYLLCRFIFCDPPEVYEEGIDYYDEEAEEEGRARERERRNTQLENVDFKK